MAFDSQQGSEMTRPHEYHRGLSLFFTFYEMQPNEIGEVYARAYLRHLQDLFLLLEDRSRLSATMLEMPFQEVIRLNYSILLLHLVRFLFRRNHVRNVDAERNLINRTIDLMATRLQIYGVSEDAVTHLTFAMREEWARMKCPDDLTMFLHSSASKFTDRKGAAIIALSGGDVEGFIMTQIIESRSY